MFYKIRGTSCRYSMDSRMLIGNPIPDFYVEAPDRDAAMRAAMEILKNRPNEEVEFSATVANVQVHVAMEIVKDPT